MEPHGDASLGHEAGVAQTQPLDLARDGLDRARRAWDAARMAVRHRSQHISYLFGETLKLWVGDVPGAARRHPMAVATPSAEIAADPPEEIPEPASITTPLQEWRRLAKRTFITVAAFSVLVNVRLGRGRVCI